MDKCIICNNSLNEKCIARSEEEYLVVIGDCNHNYHKTCLDIWFRRIQKTECPLCKKDFILSDYKEIN